MSSPAAFLDRDGTLIHDVAYIAKPSQVALVPGAAAAVRRLNDAGIPVIVVTNQSGIARGLLTVADYEAVRATADALLAAEGARIDATYMCPHGPDDRCACRKPGVLLFQRAAAEHGLDLARSVFIGDRWRDAAPAVALGGLGLIVPASSTPPDDLQRAATDGIATARTLDDAVTRFLTTLPASTVKG